MATLVKGELKWPVEKCEACGHDLREVRPKASEKANDEHGKLIWNDFCPECGHGMKVGDRLVPLKPAEILAQEEALKVVAQPAKIETFEAIDPEHQIVEGEVPTGKPSGIPPDKRARALVNKSEGQGAGEGETAEVIDPENQLGQTEETTGETLGPGEPHAPGKGQYWCTKCASIHNETSGVGKRHKKYSE